MSRVRSFYRVPAMASIAVVLAGCATVPVEERFEEARQDVQARTGYDIQFNEVSAPYETVREAIDDLLAGGLTADEAAQVALLNNPRMQALYADYGIAAAELVEAGLLKNPVFSGEMRYLRSDVQIFEFSVVQDFLDVLLTPLRVARERREFEQARLRLTAEVIDMAMDTKRDFHHYQADAQSVALWQAHLLANEAAFEMAVKLREAGNIPQMMVARWQARYEDTKMNAARAEDELAATREQLNRRMGIWGADAAWTVAAPLPHTPDADFDLVDLERRAVEDSLDLAMAWLDIEIAARTLRIGNVRALLPQFEIGVGLEGEPPENIELKKREIGDNTSYRLKESRGATRWEIGPALTLPIPLFNQGQAARTQGRARIRKQGEQFAALAIELRSAARVAGYRLENGRQRATHARNVVIPVYHERMQQATLEYNAMFIGVFALLEAKMAEIDAGRQYIRDLRDYWLAHTDMQQILMGRMVFRQPDDRADTTNRHVLAADEGHEDE